MATNKKPGRYVEFSVPMKIDISHILDEDWFYELVYDVAHNSPTMKKFLNKKVDEVLDEMSGSGEFDKLVRKAVQEKVKRLA